MTFLSLPHTGYNETPVLGGSQFFIVLRILPMEKYEQRQKTL